MSTPEPVAFGKYLLIERLGKGGMAEAWKAKLPGAAGFERMLVIKRILPHLLENERSIALFLSEARLLALLYHPNIVQIFELAEVDGEYFLALEFVDGWNMTSIIASQLEKSEPLPVGLAAFVMRDVCHALEHAHALRDPEGKKLGLIHRDVTHSNIMLSKRGDVKLLDFGIAKALHEGSAAQTRTGAFKGKAGYLAPEQIEGKAYGPLVDVWAAGVVLYEMLTMKRLFDGRTQGETFEKVLSLEITPPSSDNKGVPEALDRVCAKALCRDPGARYQSAGAMAKDLEAVSAEARWGTEQTAGWLRILHPSEVAVSVDLLTMFSTGRSSMGVGRPVSGRAWIYGGMLAAAAMLGVTLVVGGRRNGPRPMPVVVSPSDMAGSDAGVTQVDLEVEQEEVEVAPGQKRLIPRHRNNVKQPKPPPPPDVHEGDVINPFGKRGKKGR